MNICWTHQTVTAWGCPKCRAERSQAILEQALAEFDASLTKAFENCRPIKVTLVKQGASDDHE